MEAAVAWLGVEAIDGWLLVCWLNSDCSSVRGLRPRSSVMLMLAMSRSPGSAFVVEIDISLKAEFIVSSMIVLDWMESMVVSNMPFGAALVISMVGMLVLPVAAWDGWMLMVSGISGSGFRRWNYMSIRDNLTVPEQNILLGVLPTIRACLETVNPFVRDVKSIFEVWGNGRPVDNRRFVLTEKDLPSNSGPRTYGSRNLSEVMLLSDDDALRNKRDFVLFERVPTWM